MSSLLISYPSSRDIRYAHWLKHFAAQLSDYKEQYQLDSSLVLRAQHLAFEFLELLFFQMHCATAAIQQRQLQVSFKSELAMQLANCKNVIQNEVVSVIADIEQQPIYLAAADCKLKLFPPGSRPALEAVGSLVRAASAAPYFA